MPITATPTPERTKANGRRRAVPDPISTPAGVEPTMIVRRSEQRWVAIALMQVTLFAQRRFSQAHADEYAADFDLEGFGYPVLSFRDGVFWIVDGQHRVAALRLIGWGDQQILCEVYEGLNEADEAEMFLKRNKRRTVHPFEMFRISVNAGRPEAVEINRIVGSLGLSLSSSSGDGTISAVGSLVKAFRLDGTGQAMALALVTLRDAWGGFDEVLKADMISGFSILYHRFGAAVDQTRMITKLRNTPGGVVGVRTKAASHKAIMGRLMGDCIAAAVIDFYNAGTRAGRLESWWR